MNIKENNMKDFLGNELNVGDIVVYMSSYYKRLQKGVVIKVNPKKVSIQGSYSMEQREHDKVFRVASGDVKKFREFECWSDKTLLNTVWLDENLTNEQAYEKIKEMNLFNPEYKVNIC